MLAAIDQAAAPTFDRIADDLGGLDALVNVAGGFRREQIEGGTLDTWDFLYNVNVRTATAAIQAAHGGQCGAAELHRGELRPSNPAAEMGIGHGKTVLRGIGALVPVTGRSSSSASRTSRI